MGFYEDMKRREYERYCVSYNMGKSMSIAVTIACQLSVIIGVCAGGWQTQTFVLLYALTCSAWFASAVMTETDFTITDEIVESGKYSLLSPCPEDALAMFTSLIFSLLGLILLYYGCWHWVLFLFSCVIVTACYCSWRTYYR